MYTGFHMYQGFFLRSLRGNDAAHFRTGNHRHRDTWNVTNMKPVDAESRIISGFEYHLFLITKIKRQSLELAMINFFTNWQIIKIRIPLCEAWSYPFILNVATSLLQKLKTRASEVRCGIVKNAFGTNQWDHWQ